MSPGDGRMVGRQASLAGLRTLMEGGNAIDAAVAVASCIGATEIGLSGMMA